MKTLFLFITIFFSYSIGTAQQYKVTTDQTDDFSVVFVKLLQCGMDKFNDCKGAFLQNTFMSETEHELTIQFPNSIAGIIRSGSWDKNTYVEFGPFKKEELGEEMKKLQKKISKALGKQLYKDDRKPEANSFYMMSIADENGFFQSNFEMFSGNTSEKSYLLKPVMKEEDKNAPTHNFILLKVYDRTPSYYHYIPAAVKAPDETLHKTLQELIKGAAADFKTLTFYNDTLLKKRRVKTFQLNGQTVLLNTRSSHHTAIIRIPAAKDSVAFEQQWQYYQQVMQAAVGPDFVYYSYNLSYGPSVLFFDKKYNQQQARLYLTVDGWKTKDAYIQLEIQSNISHPTKRSASFNDEEEEEF